MCLVITPILDPRMPAVIEADLLGTYLQCSPGVNKPEQSGAGVNADSEGSTEGVIRGEPPPFPVIVFSHGLGGMRTTYSGICCDLASHGYVVAAVEHRYIPSILCRNLYMLKDGVTAFIIVYHLLQGSFGLCQFSESQSVWSRFQSRDTAVSRRVDRFLPQTGNRERVSNQKQTGDPAWLIDSWCAVSSVNICIGFAAFSRGHSDPGAADQIE